jgi:hypothetical protein
MVPYKNNYSKNEDPMMWALHQIRHKMAKKKLNFSEINKLATEFQNTPNPGVTHKNKKVR